MKKKLFGALAAVCALAATLVASSASISRKSPRRCPINKTDGKGSWRGRLAQAGFPYSNMYAEGEPTARG